MKTSFYPAMPASIRICSMSCGQTGSWAGTTSLSGGGFRWLRRWRTLARIGLGDPAMAQPAGAMVGAVAEEMVDVVHRMSLSRRANVERFAETVADEAGVPLEELLGAASPRAPEFLAWTVTAASQAVDDWKVDVLAAVWAKSTIDDSLLVVDALRRLDVSHLRLLQIREPVCYPGWRPSSQANPERKVLPMVSIIREDAGLERAVDVLAGELVSLGMALNGSP